MAKREGKAAYLNVGVSSDLMAEVDGLLEQGGLGYRSRMEFVADAIRRHLLYVQRELTARRWARHEAGFHLDKV